VEFEERIQWIRKVNPIVLVSVIGLMGTGKTNFAYVLYDKFFYDYQLIHYESYFNSNGELIFNQIIEDFKTKKDAFIIFDDMSFITNTYSKDVNHFLSELMRIRHYIQQGVLVFISHYRHSILPVLREAHIIALTTLFPNQFKDMSNIFTWDSMVRFANIVMNFNPEHKILVWLYGHVWIVPIPLSDTYRQKFGK
jgi:hypothetical protein